MARNINWVTQLLKIISIYDEILVWNRGLNITHKKIKSMIKTVFFKTFIWQNLSVTLRT
jgi:hypothetical protein